MAFTTRTGSYGDQCIERTSPAPLAFIIALFAFPSPSPSSLSLLRRFSLPSFFLLSFLEDFFLLSLSFFPDLPRFLCFLLFLRLREEEEEEDDDDPSESESSESDDEPPRSRLAFFRFPPPPPPPRRRRRSPCS